MLITISDLKLIWNVKPQSVLHVGAHMAEEGPEYLKHGWGHVTWIEAQPKLASNLKKLLDPSTNLVIEAAIWDQSGVELELKIASNSQSTSLLDFGTHTTTYPDITFVEKIRVRTITLDEVLPKNMHPDFLNLDIQGVELQALKGMSSRLSKVRWIYTEVNSEDVYKDCTKLPELDAFLQDCGFIRLHTRWSHSKTWGDALYGRTENYKKLQIIKMKILQFTKFKLIEFINKFRRLTEVLSNKIRSQNK